MTTRTERRKEARQKMAEISGPTQMELFIQFMQTIGQKADASASDLPHKTDQLLPQLIKWASERAQLGDPLTAEEEQLLYLLARRSSLRDQEILWNRYSMYVVPPLNDGLATRAIMAQVCEHSLLGDFMFHKVPYFPLEIQTLIFQTRKKIKPLIPADWSKCLKQLMILATKQTLPHYEREIAYTENPLQRLRMIDLIPDEIKPPLILQDFETIINQATLYVSDQATLLKEGNISDVEIKIEDLKELPTSVYDNVALLQEVASFLFLLLQKYSDVLSEIVGFFAGLKTQARLCIPNFFVWLANELKINRLDIYIPLLQVMETEEWMSEPTLIDIVANLIIDETTFKPDEMRFFAHSFPVEIPKLIKSLPQEITDLLNIRLKQHHQFQRHSFPMSIEEAKLHLICSACDLIGDDQSKDAVSIINYCQENHWLDYEFLPMLALISPASRQKLETIIGEIISQKMSDQDYITDKFEAMTDFLKSLPEEEQKKWQKYLYELKVVYPEMRMTSPACALFLRNPEWERLLPAVDLRSQGDLVLARYPGHKEILGLISDLVSEVGNHQQREQFMRALVQYLLDPSQSFIFLNSVARAKQRRGTKNGKSMMAVTLGLYTLGFRADLWMSESWRSMGEYDKQNLISLLSSVLGNKQLITSIFGDGKIQFEDVSLESLLDWLMLLNQYLSEAKKLYPSENRSVFDLSIYRALNELFCQSIEDQIKTLPILNIGDKSVSLVDLRQEDEDALKIEKAWGVRDSADSAIDRYRARLDGPSKESFRSLIRQLAQTPNIPPYSQVPTAQDLFGFLSDFQPTRDWWSQYLKPYAEVVQIGETFYLLHTTHHPLTLFELGIHPATNSCYRPESEHPSLVPGILGIVGNPQISATVLRPIVNATDFMTVSMIEDHLKVRTNTLDEVHLRCGEIRLGKPVAKAVLILGAAREGRRTPLILTAGWNKESGIRVDKDILVGFLANYTTLLSTFGPHCPIRAFVNDEKIDSKYMPVRSMGGPFQAQLDLFTIGELTPINKVFNLSMRV